MIKPWCLDEIGILVIYKLHKTMRCFYSCRPKRTECIFYERIPAERKYGLSQYKIGIP